MGKLFFRFAVLTLLLTMCSVNYATTMFHIGNLSFVAYYSPTVLIVSGSGIDKDYGDLVIPKTVEYNGKTYTVIILSGQAFSCCKGLKTVYVPEGLQVEERAFSFCVNLTSATVGSLGAHMFDECTSLTSVTFSKGIKLITPGAFCGCSSLNSITLPDSLTKIKEVAFAGCSSLASITLPNTLTHIGYRAFSGCSSLTSITIPNSVTDIEQRAFENCSNLTSITIGSGVKDLLSCFVGCDRITSVTCLKKTPPSSSGSSVVSEFVYEKAVLYVPIGSLEAYKSDFYWGRFHNIVELDVTKVNNAKINNSAPSNDYNLNGVRVPKGSARKGIYIKNGKKVIIK